MSKVDFRTGDLNRAYGGMVGVTRKGINFIRKRVTPHDPESANQLNYREAMRLLTSWGRRIYPDILKTRTMGLKPGMSQFNKYIQVNSVIRQNKAFTFADWLLFDGKLFNPGISTFDAIAPTDEAEITWSTEIQGEAKSADNVNELYVNETKNIWVRSVNHARSQGDFIQTLSLSVGDVVHCYQFFRNSTQNTWSKSSYKTTVAIP